MACTFKEKNHAFYKVLIQPLSISVGYLKRGIIEHDHNQMAVFTIGYCSNLTRSVLANQKACVSFLINRPALAL